MAFLPPKRKIMELLEESPNSRSFRFIRNYFRLPKSANKQIKVLLDKMVTEGLLQKVHGKNYIIRPKRNQTEDKYEGVKIKGEKLQPREAKNPLHRSSVRGKIERLDGKMWLVPFGVSSKQEVKEKKRYLIPKKHLNKGKDGDLAVGKLLDGSDTKPAIKVESVYKQKAKFSDVSKRFFKENNLPFEYPRQAEKEAESFPQPRFQKGKGRSDLRNLEVCTIDPATAKDHDDAISIEKSAKGWQLGVHIADVSHYVPFQSAIDKEARIRAFTQYLPWTASPMLPESLASDLCSLREGTNRFALSCFIDLDLDGKVLKYRFEETVIRVRKFFNYEMAQKQKESGDEFLGRLAELAGCLRNKRKVDGFLDFEMPEPKVVLDENSEPVDILESERLDSYTWIEECMLVANQCAAQFLVSHKLPGIYRVHEQPDLQSIQSLSNMLNLWGESRKMPRMPRGIKQTQGNLNTKLQKFLGTLLAGRGELALPPTVQRKVLRSMKKARYSPQCDGHFALGWKYYAHFTSPIRRYADLWVHRVIKQYLRKKPLKENSRALAGPMADHISQRELEVQKTERQSVRCAMAWIMRAYIGDEFEAHVTGVESFGLFVGLDKPQVEGLLPMRSLKGDFYLHDEDAQILVGQRNGFVFRIGDRLKVRLVKSDPVAGQMDFEYLDDNKSGKHVTSILKKSNRSPKKQKRTFRK